MDKTMKFNKITFKDGTVYCSRCNSKIMAKVKACVILKLSINDIQSIKTIGL